MSEKTSTAPPEIRRPLYAPSEPIRQHLGKRSKLQAMARKTRSDDNSFVVGVLVDDEVVVVCRCIGTCVVASSDERGSKMFV